MSGTISPALLTYLQSLQGNTPAATPALPPMSGYLGGPPSASAFPIPTGGAPAFPIPTPPTTYANDAVGFPPEYFKAQQVINPKGTTTPMDQQLNQLLRAMFMHRAGQT